MTGDGQKIFTTMKSNRQTIGDGNGDEDKTFSDGSAHAVPGRSDDGQRGPRAATGKLPGITDRKVQQNSAEATRIAGWFDRLFGKKKKNDGTAGGGAGGGDKKKPDKPGQKTDKSKSRKKDKGKNKEKEKAALEKKEKATIEAGAEGQFGKTRQKPGMDIDDAQKAAESAARTGKFASSPRPKGDDDAPSVVLERVQPSQKAEEEMARRLDEAWKKANQSAAAKGKKGTSAKKSKMTRIGIETGKDSKDKSKKKQ